MICAGRRLPASTPGPTWTGSGEDSTICSTVRWPSTGLRCGQSAAADASRLRLHHQRSHLIRLRYEVEQVARHLQARADELYADAARVEAAAEAALREEARELELQASYFQ